MLPRQDFEGHAQGVPDGGSRRFPHHCGDGRPLQISRDGPAIRAWCHRCGEGGALRLQETAAEALARIQAQQAGDSTIGLVPPLPAVRNVSEWPPGAAVWLYKAGLSRADIGELGIYWHPPSARVVIPYGTFYQARAYQKGRTPKYLGPTPKPRDLIVSFGAGPEIVLCEDMLSAIKVGRVTEAWAVLGVRLSEHHLATLLQRNATVAVWLDPDPPGQVGAHKIMRQLRAVGIPCRNIVSGKDPKLYNKEQIWALWTSSECT